MNSEPRSIREADAGRCDVTMTVRLPKWLADAAREDCRRTATPLSVKIRQALVQQLGTRDDPAQRAA